MERIFCKDKKDFCDGAEDCTKCQYAKGNGLIAGYVAHDLLCALFGNDYDLGRLRELAEADREGRCAVLLCKPGDKIWVIERDRNKEAESIAEYIFLSQVKDCIIAGFIDMSDDADIILEEQVRQTLFDYNGSLPVFPACDCYLDKDSALKMMKEKENNES